MNGVKERVAAYDKCRRRQIPFQILHWVLWDRRYSSISPLHLTLSIIGTSSPNRQWENQLKRVFTINSIRNDFEEIIINIDTRFSIRLNSIWKHFDLNGQHQRQRRRQQKLLYILTYSIYNQLLSFQLYIQLNRWIYFNFIIHLFNAVYWNLFASI